MFLKGNTVKNGKSEFDYGSNGLICSALILGLMYILIIFEVVHRTIAAILASTLAVAAMGVLRERPTMNEICLSVDAETLMLLFSMMILVSLMVPTGIFDYSAVLALQVSFY